MQWAEELVQVRILPVECVESELDKLRRATTEARQGNSAPLLPAAEKARAGKSSEWLDRLNGKKPMSVQPQQPKRTIWHPVREAAKQPGQFASIGYPVCEAVEQREQTAASIGYPVASAFCTAAGQHRNPSAGLTALERLRLSIGQPSRVQVH